MFSFFKMRIFKKKYILYAVVMLVLSLVLCVCICLVFLNARAAALRQDALKAFESTERTIADTVDSIESYVLRLYSNSPLAHDMENLIGHSLEEYLAFRLDAAGAGASIIDSIQDYAKEGGRTRFIRISLHSRENATVFAFTQGQSTSKSLVANDDPVFDTGIGEGISYTRRLDSPGNIYQEMGEIRFLIASDYIFAAAANYGLPNLAAVDDKGRRYEIAGDGAIGPEIYDTIIAQGESQGVLYDGLKRVSYTVFTSSAYQYKLIMAYDDGYLLQQNSTPVIVTVLSALALYFGIMLTIALNMRQDADFLGQIIETIDRAKTGDFRPVPNPYRAQNEYRMIADSLNDMTQKLEQHIRTEYLLKLRQQQTEMKALQHQINPHFLYNTLEIIRSAAVVNRDDQVAGAITNLGQIYRGITKAGNVVTFREELSILNAYLELMAFRYKDSFSYSADIEPDMLEMETVKFWLQPIAENFFSHGYDITSDFNLFVLNGYRDECGWVIEMIDNGLGIEPGRLAALAQSIEGAGDDSQDGVGLRNVYTRLRYFYGEGISMQIMNNTDAGITVQVRLVEGGGQD